MPLLHGVLDSVAASAHWSLDGAGPHAGQVRGANRKKAGLGPPKMPHQGIGCIGSEAQDGKAIARQLHAAILQGGAFAEQDRLTGAVELVRIRGQVEHTEELAAAHE